MKVRMTTATPAQLQQALTNVFRAKLRYYVQCRRLEVLLDASLPEDVWRDLDFLAGEFDDAQTATATPDHVTALLAKLEALP